ncbi:MAG: di-heme-cytochrome C peroxidase [Planctomycetota bacterium]
MKRHWNLICLLIVLALGCSNEGSKNSSSPTAPAAGGNKKVPAAGDGSTPAATGVDRVIPPSINRKPGFDADTFHYAEQGSGFFPMAVVRALIDSETNEPYLKNLERFGLVAGEKSERNPEGFPVGIVTNSVKVGDIDVKMFGFTCAACHTSDIRYKDKIVRIEGGSGLYYVDALGDAIALSLEKTLADKRALFEFLLRLIGELEESERGLFGGLEDVAHLLEGEFGEALFQHVQKRIAEIEKAGKQASRLEKAVVADIAKALHGLAHTANSPLRKLAESKRLAAIHATLSGLEQSLEHLKYRLHFLKMRAWLAKPGNRLPAGYGRADDFGTARVELFGELNETKGTSEQRNMEPVNAPVGCPPLWNIDQYAWLHWNANTNSVIQRSIGESIGVGATYDPSGPTIHDTSVNIANQMKIEQQIPHIAAPEWPEEILGKIDPAKRDHGYKIYKEKCADCHDPSERDEKKLLKFQLFTLEETGTDPADAQNFSKPVFQPDGQGGFTQLGFAKAIGGLLAQLQAKAKLKMIANDQKEDVKLMEKLEEVRPPQWRDPLTEEGGKVYPAKPLDGVWATAPYLHNGSVPTLYHLLLPAKDRPGKFVVGSQDYLPDHVGFEWDPKDFPGLKDKHNPQKKLFLFDTIPEGNRNTGHEYGADLSNDDRLALLEYLKVHKTPSLSGETSPQATSDRTNDKAWPDVQATIERTLTTYLQQNADGYDWFANATDGYSGVPVILMRSFPDLAPEIWGKPEEQFSRFGLIPSPTEPDRPLPLGLSWDSMVAGRKAPDMNGVTLTCGACHIGRARITDGDKPTYKTLVGAPNTQFDVRLWRHAFERTVKELLSTPEDIAKTAARLREIIASKPEDYYYRQYRGLSADVEKRERAEFAVTDGKDVAALILTGFAQGIALSKTAVDKQKATSYGKENAPPLDGGSPGQSDGSGDLIPRLLLLDTIVAKGPQATLHDFPEMTFGALPDKKATVTDIVSTFNQGARNIAQIDGSVKSPFYRNVAASLAVAGNPSQVNVPNAEITAGFIRALPPPAYPFEVDMARANRGRKLFEENCAVCHRDHNDIVYKAANETVREQIGTDPNRSQVLNGEALQLFLRHFVASVPKNFETKDAQGNTYRPHDLPANEIVFDRSEFPNQGYVTNALEGVWSRAPYLHNGAVPTLYHLLVPAERPSKFARGSISYDQKNVGWLWKIEMLDELRKADPTVAVFDTSWDSASKRGHDTNLTVDADGRILRMDWNGPDNSSERRVRLNWSGAENAEGRNDLIEYLKTL